MSYKRYISTARSKGSTEQERGGTNNKGGKLSNNEQIMILSAKKSLTLHAISIIQTENK
jgi:hypothetical protein